MRIKMLDNVWKEALIELQELLKKKKNKTKKEQKTLKYLF